MTFRQLQAIADISILANDAGIKSTQQLTLFLECAAFEGQCLSDIVGLAADTPEYKNKYAMARQLMLGAANRNYNGAKLLKWGEALYGKERAIVLSVKGKKLLKELERKLILT